MQELTQQSLERFLNQLADRSPTPGGGSATGVAGALGCALAQMVVAYSVNKKTAPDVRVEAEAASSRLRRADELIRALISQDAAAYAAMTDAARSAKEDSSARTAHQDAILAAIAVPMEMAALASNALAVMDDFKAQTSRYLLSDLGIAAVLADATVRATRYTVRVNARELSDGARRAAIQEEIEQITDHAARHRASIEAFVCDDLETDRADGR